jgi:hypothetical protein
VAEEAACTPVSASTRRLSDTDQTTPTRQHGLGTRARDTSAFRLRALSGPGGDLQDAKIDDGESVADPASLPWSMPVLASALESSCGDRLCVTDGTG